MSHGVASVAVALGVAGCQAAAPVDINRANLMPDPVARKVISDLIPGYAGGESFTLGEDAIQIRTVRALHLYSPARKLQISTPRRGAGGPMICNVALDDVRKFAEALTALGASPEVTDHDEPVLTGYCAVTKR
jgi:hypothetical protein